MTRPLRLQSFDLGPGPARGEAAVSGAEAEELRLGAYEQGYAAGWDDAIAAQDDEIARLRTDLGHSLREMALNHHDARRHVLAALEPLLSDMIAKVLPAIAHRSLGPMIIEVLEPVARDLSEAPITILTAPQHCQTVEALLAATHAGLAAVVRAEPALGDGQAYLKVGAHETRIDLDSVVQAIGQAVSGFFLTEREEEGEGP